jgi:signal transduction histidine kinase
LINIPHNFTPEAKSNIYRVIQEAITNILKHSCASQVSIDFYSDNESINLIILDNGKGANVDSPKIKKGFVTMRHRIEVMHGTISFESDPGSFFKITIKLPKNRQIQEKP